MFLFIILKFNNVLLKSLFLGDWNINNPSSSNVIYDEQSPFHPSSHSAFIFEESRVPVIEESLMRVQICEKAEELKDIVPESGSPAKKTPITPGPWKVPSASRATGTTGVAEKRL